METFAIDFGGCGVDGAEPEIPWHPVGARVGGGLRYSWRLETHTVFHAVVALVPLARGTPRMSDAVVGAGPQGVGWSTLIVGAVVHALRNVLERRSRWLLCLRRSVNRYYQMARLIDSGCCVRRRPCSYFRALPSYARRDCRCYRRYR